LVHPYHWKDQAAFARDIQPSIDPGAWCWMLTSGSLGQLTTWSRDQILESPTAIGRVFQHALAFAAEIGDTSRKPTPGSGHNTP
jgi:hypothetical protein